MRPRHRFGQHFLQAEWIGRVVDAIHPTRDDTILEIGPGRGAITLPLAKRVKRLVAIEIDRDLAPQLAARVPSNVDVVTADVLQADLSAWLDPSAPVRVVGNLPYNISTPILFAVLHVAGDGRRVADATVMLQREVADRLTARPGTKAWGVLSACQQLRAAVTSLLALPPYAFRPAPDVHSNVVRISYHPPEPAVASVEGFEAMVRALFLHRRKMLSNALEAYAASRGFEARSALARAAIDGNRRAETLAVAELARLSDVFESGEPPAVGPLTSDF